VAGGVVIFDNRKGFSLVELIIVVGIIGILLSIATLNFNSWQQKAQIERQTRELYADLNQARIDSIHLKLRHSIVMQSKSYTVKSYSSEDENRSSGTVMQTRNVSYQISRVTGSSATDGIIEFDIRGFTDDWSTYAINPAGTAAQIDCIVISVARINLGKMENGSCVVK
jgi:prepilin-type N-terminal cleavage/methylation domain-containing protein